MSEKLERWYRLQRFTGGKWVDAGDVYEEETKRWCRGQMVRVNFFPDKVRMVEHFHGWRPVGKVYDTSNPKRKTHERAI